MERGYISFLNYIRDNDFCMYNMQYSYTWINWVQLIKLGVLLFDKRVPYRPAWGDYFGKVTIYDCDYLTILRLNYN